MGLVVENGTYTLKTDMFPSYSCVLLPWPVKNPVGILKCDNGKYSTIEYADKNTLIFDDMKFTKEILDDAEACI